MGFLSSIGKGIKDIGKGMGKLAGNVSGVISDVAQVAAPIGDIVTGGQFSTVVNGVTGQLDTVSGFLEGSKGDKQVNQPNYPPSGGNLPPSPSTPSPSVPHRAISSFREHAGPLKSVHINDARVERLKETWFDKNWGFVAAGAALLILKKRAN